jgi:hypothetical protein
MVECPGMYFLVEIRGDAHRAMGLLAAAGFRTSCRATIPPGE